jgi:ribonuclease HII
MRFIISLAVMAARRTGGRPPRKNPGGAGREKFPATLYGALHPGPLTRRDPLWKSLPPKEREQERLRRLFFHEEPLWAEGFERIAGVDEAGVGALAGPVVAAAVILPRGASIPGLNDSKRLTPARRAALFPKIRKAALAVATGRTSPREVDKLNVYRAALLAMRRALERLPLRPQFVLVDARRIPDINVPQRPIVMGDALSHTIAAASIVAKVTRDRLMTRYVGKYPSYGFSAHKGYGTAAHKAAIRRHGVLSIHRKSFNLE